MIVAGMPAAGTALITQCLRGCGVQFVDGCGPARPCGDVRSPAEPWGWVDAGGSLGVAVWLAGHPSARVVVCLRNPLEVAVSLRERHDVDLDTGLALWRRHVKMVLATTTAATRVVAHYDAFRRDPVAATARLAATLGLTAPADPAAIRRAAVKGSTPRFTMRDLVDSGADEQTCATYRQLCAEAGHTDVGRAGSRPGRGVLRELAAACQRLQPPSAPPASSPDTLESVRTEVARLRDEVTSRDDAIQDLLEELRNDFEEERLSPAKRAYRRTIRSVRAMIQECVSRDAIVAIVSKGDEELLRQRHCTAWHFPRDPWGVYLGYHPAVDLAAIANLETVRALGATHLLVPETHAWWLTNYPGFHRHLERYARLVESRPGVGTLYDLAPVTAAEPPAAEKLADAIGRPPQVLAWNAPAAADVFPGARIFEPPDLSRRLPYVDRSIDVVAVTRPPAAELAEARRVASVAVVDVADEPVIEWVQRPVVPEPPAVSIVIPVHGNWPVTAACLRVLLPSLPVGWPVEVIVVDDASPDETPVRLAAIAATDPRLRVLRNEDNLGFVGTCNRGAAAATGDYLVFLNNDTVPLPGWLPPLIHTFRDFPRAGVVGGKLLFPDGRLQEAGGVIFSDASACHVGREHPDPSWTPFRHVRPVDYVSGALLATPRRLFAELGGFDLAFAPGYYEDTDYCFRLRELGREVLFQPASLVVHVEGATAGTDGAAGMKRFQEINRRRFQARHAAALMRQRSRPPVIDGDSWATLVHRGADPEAT